MNSGETAYGIHQAVGNKGYKIMQRLFQIDR